MDLRLAWYIARWEGPSLGLLLDYTVLTWVGKSLSLIDGNKLGKPVEACIGQMIGFSLGLSLGTSEVNVVDLIFVKYLWFMIIATDELTISLSLGPVLVMWEVFLPEFSAGGKVGTLLGCCVVKWLYVTLCFKICNTLDIVLSLCDGFLLIFVLGKKIRTKNVFIWWLCWISTGFCAVHNHSHLSS